jgi:hydroxypyruvate reductase
MTPASPRDDAARIWRAALSAVTPEALVGALPADAIPVGPGGRITVVGAGKAAAGMAAAVAARLTGDGVDPRHVIGLVSVPDGLGTWCGGIEIRATRPTGCNEPTAAVVTATEQMLDLVGALAPDDLAIAVVTGGGSALLEAPAEGIALAESVAVARGLSRAGAGIGPLNTVRRALSRVKAGGLARSCRAGKMVVLVLSDVIGDPLDLIASGPCMPAPPDPAAARAVLEQFRFAAATAPAIRARLAGEADPPPATGPIAHDWTTPLGCHVTHRVVGNNATAVAAARAAARDLGYRIAVDAPRPPAADEPAEEVGRRLLEIGHTLLTASRRQGAALAWIEGGEATVRVPDHHGEGGRNQQTVLAALERALAPEPHGFGGRWPEGLVIASLGTDGEDGPTAAAGGVADAAVARRLAGAHRTVSTALARCDAGPLLSRGGGLIVTGPTGTNVADLRVVLARP